MSRYTVLKAAGLCVSCGKAPAEDGKTRCAECSKKRSENQKNVREYRAARGLCVRCGRETWHGHKLCIECRGKDRDSKAGKSKTGEQRAKANADNKKYRERMKAEHRCVDCGKPLPEKWKKTRCGTCNARHRRANAEYRRKKGVARLDLAGNGHYCAICCKPVEIIGNKLCERCYQKSVENVKAANDNTDRSYFRGLNRVFWQERRNKK